MAKLMMGIKPMKVRVCVEVSLGGSDSGSAACELLDNIHLSYVKPQCWASYLTQKSSKCLLNWIPTAQMQIKPQNSHKETLEMS